MSTITKEQLIEDLKASTQNSSGMFEIGEETICALMSLLTAPPAPVSDEDLLHMAASAIDDLLSNKDRSGAGVWADIPAKLRRAAMLQGAEPVTTAYKLPKPIKDHRLNSGPDADDYYSGYQAGWNDSIGEAVICNYPVIPDCSTSAAQFVKDYCKSAGWTEQEFYETQVPMPDITSPSGWAAVSNSPLAIKSHVDLYMRTEPQQDALK